MTFGKFLTAGAIIFMLSTSAASAQDQSQQPPDANAPQNPVPPVAPDQSGNNSQQPAPAGTVGGSADSTIQPGSSPLGGAVVSGVISPTGRPNVLDPALHISVGPDTGIAVGKTNADISLGGSLSLDHYWVRNEFTLQYVGGYSAYIPTSGNDSQYHDLSVADVTVHRRFTLQLRDDFTDSSGAVFGGLNTGGPGLTVPVGFINNLDPTISSQQTILTTSASRISDTALGEVDYALSRHSALTFAGSAEILHFLSGGYVNSTLLDGHGAYSVQLSRRNSVAFTYDYNYTTFNGAVGAVTSQTPQIAYGLKLSGRLAFQASGGPQVIYVQNLGGGRTSQWSWNASTSVLYVQRRNGYNVSYSHGLTNGSGVFLGATSDTVSGTVQTTVHRKWTPSFSAGYSHNTNLSIDSTMSSFYGNWFGTIAVGRLWGRTLHTTASYGLQEQNTNSGSCPVASCGPDTLRQVFTVTVDWHPRPISIQ